MQQHRYGLIAIVSCCPYPSSTSKTDDEMMRTQFPFGHFSFLSLTHTAVTVASCCPEWTTTASHNSNLSHCNRTKLSSILLLSILASNRPTTKTVRLKHRSFFGTFSFCHHLLSLVDYHLGLGVNPLASVACPVSLLRSRIYRPVYTNHVLRLRCLPYKASTENQRLTYTTMLIWDDKSPVGVV